MTRRGDHTVKPGRLLAPTRPKVDRTMPDGPDLQTQRALADLAATGSIDELVELAHYLAPADQLRGVRRT